MSSQRDKIEKALLLYLLTDSDISTLAETILSNMLKTLQAAYRWAAKYAGISSEWVPTQELRTAIESLAKGHAQSVADTYASDLQEASQRFLDAYEQAHGTLDGAAIALAAMLHDWTQARNGYKPEQVAGYETSVAGNMGTKEFIQDADSGEFDEEFEEADIDISDVFVGVLPDTAATPDVCDEWAGQMLSLEDAIANLPTFPAHIGCPHFTVVINTTY